MTEKDIFFSIRKKNGFDSAGNYKEKNQAEPFGLNLLSNMNGVHIEMEDGQLEGPGELLFHYYKYFKCSEFCEDAERKKELLTYSRHLYDFYHTNLSNGSVINGFEIKKLGGRRGLQLTTDEIKHWDQINFEVQKNICRCKFEQNDNVRKVLKFSGDRKLIHQSFRGTSDKWTYNSKKRQGSNLLGIIWMDLRNELNK